MSDLGIVNASSQSVTNPLPKSWLGRVDMTVAAPTWSNINNPTTDAQILTNQQLRNLLAQIGYDQSSWDYDKIGDQNQLGRYQISTQMLEAYGLLAAGSTKAYGINSVNYRHCWRPIYNNQGSTSSYQNYFFNTLSLESFTSTHIAQDYLAYQRLVDLYLAASKNKTILDTDTSDIVAGMMYVCWTLGVGQASNSALPQGTGAYAWRYHNIGNGANSYNSGRYAITVLSN